MRSALATGKGINAEARRVGRIAKWFEDRARMENSTIPLTDPFLKNSTILWTDPFMLSATCWGMACQRTRCRVATGNDCQR